jgi:riboflavin synthase alpha subunit
MSKTSLKDILRMVQEQNVRENLPPTTYEGWYPESSTTDVINNAYAKRKLQRADGYRDDDGRSIHINDADPNDPMGWHTVQGHLDPVEDLQPQHMVSPKENMWIQLLKGSK